MLHFRISIGQWDPFRAVLEGRDSVERIADVVETVLGVLILAEGVAQLKQLLDYLEAPPHLHGSLVSLPQCRRQR